MKKKVTAFALAALLVLCGCGTSSEGIAPDEMYISSMFSSVITEAEKDPAVIAELYELYQNMEVGQKTEGSFAVGSLSVSFRNTETGESEDFSITADGHCYDYINDEFVYYELENGKDIYQKFYEQYQLMISEALFHGDSVTISKPDAGVEGLEVTDHQQANNLYVYYWVASGNRTEELSEAEVDLSSPIYVTFTDAGLGKSRSIILYSDGSYSPQPEEWETQRRYYRLGTYGKGGDCTALYRLYESQCLEHLAETEEEADYAEAEAVLEYLLGYDGKANVRYESTENSNYLPRSIDCGENTMLAQVLGLADWTYRSTAPAGGPEEWFLFTAAGGEEWSLCLWLNGETYELAFESGEICHYWFGRGKTGFMDTLMARYGSLFDDPEYPGYVSEAISVNIPAGTPQAVVDEAEKAAEEWHRSMDENFPWYELTDHRVLWIREAHSYDLDGETYVLYSYQYEVLAGQPQRVMVAGSSYVTTEGWYGAGYAGMYHLIYHPASGRCLGRIENQEQNYEAEWFIEKLRETIAAAEAGGEELCTWPTDMSGVPESIRTRAETVARREYENFRGKYGDNISDWRVQDIRLVHRFEADGGSYQVYQLNYELLCQRPEEIELGGWPDNYITAQGWYCGNGPYVYNIVYNANSQRTAVVFRNSSDWYTTASGAEQMEQKLEEDLRVLAEGLVSGDQIPSDFEVHGSGAYSRSDLNAQEAEALWNMLKGLEPVECVWDEYPWSENLYIVQADGLRIVFWPDGMVSYGGLSDYLCENVDLSVLEDILSRPSLPVEVVKSQEDIDAAMEAVRAHFAENAPGCTIEDLWYEDYASAYYTIEYFGSTAPEDMATELVTMLFLRYSSESGQSLLYTSPGETLGVFLTRDSADGPWQVKNLIQGVITEG